MSHVAHIVADHVPMLPYERARIEKNGGMVAAFPDEPPPEVSGKVCERECVYARTSERVRVFVFLDELKRERSRCECV